MPENSENLDIIRSGPDFFGLCKSEIEDLLSQDDSLLPLLRRVSELSGNLNGVGKEKELTKKSCQTKGNNAAPLFSNGIGALLSDFKKERLCSLLRQNVFTLTREVDEIENPVLSVYRIRKCLSHKETLLSQDASMCKADDRLLPPKKKARVITACPDLESEDDDMRFILEHDSSKVVELMESHTREIFTMLDHMETKLEEILNVVMTTCRAMTLIEKQELRKLIQKLPATCFDRLVEIIEQTNPVQTCSGSNLNVDLDKLDNVTVWRLYFYVELQALHQRPDG